MDAKNLKPGLMIKHRSGPIYLVLRRLKPCDEGYKHWGNNGFLFFSFNKQEIISTWVGEFIYNCEQIAP